MTTTKSTQKPKAKKKAGNHRIYPVEYFLEKYNLTPDAFQALAQANLKPIHIKAGQGVTFAGLLQIGKAIKKQQRDAVAVVVKAEKDAPVIRDLRVLALKPPNRQKLWCIDSVDGVDYKVVVNAERKFVDGVKAETVISCERIEEGLFTYPPLNRD